MKQLEMIKGFCGSDVVKYLYVGDHKVWPAGEPDPSTLLYYTSIDERIVYPSSLASFGANIISNTYKNGIGCIRFDGPITKIGGQSFQSNKYLSSIKIPDSVSSIGNYAFDGCSKLSSINIPDSVTWIGEGAFWSCSSLTSIEIPDAVEYIQQYTFRNCTSLTNVKLPASLKELGFNAFNDCSNLTNVELPASLKEFGSNVFWGCTSLFSITSHATIAPGISEFVFYNISPTGTLYYPAGSNYSTWKKYLPSGWTYVEI